MKCCTAIVTVEVQIMFHSPELTVTTADALRVLHWLCVSMCVGQQDEFLLYTCTNRVVVMWSTLINKVMIIWCMKLDLFLSFFDWGVVACSVYNLWQQMSRRFIILQSTLQTFWWICALCHVLCNCLERLVQNHLGLFSIQV